MENVINVINELREKKLALRWFNMSVQEIVDSYRFELNDARTKREIHQKILNLFNNYNAKKLHKDYCNRKK